MLKIDNLEKSISGKTLFKKVFFNVHNEDKIGLIGPNGSGKSTLLKIIMGLQKADNGVVSKDNEILGYLPQNFEYKETETVDSYLREALEEEWEEYKFDIVLDQVSLTLIDRDLLMTQLSGGQKTRIELAKLLITEPDILILDEPTNNLDLKSIEWLEKFVKQFKGGVLIVSHDREFLDNTVKKILEIDSFTKSINEYAGNYSFYVEEKKTICRKQLQHHKVQERERKQIENLITLERQKLVAGAGRAGFLSNLKHRHKREILDSRIDRPKKGKKMKISSLSNDVYKDKQVFKAKMVYLAPIVSCEECIVHAGDRIHLKGDNGSGKSSFLKVLLGLNKNFEGEVFRSSTCKIGYFEQEHEYLDKSKSVLEEFVSKSDIKDKDKARKVLGSFLFIGEDVFKTVKDLSLGERVRLIIAELTTQDNEFLILDEPTNHLDAESREVLEKALFEYTGGFIVISHDRYFLKQIEITRILEIVNREVCDRYEI